MSSSVASARTTGRTSRRTSRTSRTTRELEGINLRGFTRAIDYLRIVAAQETIEKLFVDIDAGSILVRKPSLLRNLLLTRAVLVLFFRWVGIHRSPRVY